MYKGRTSFSSGPIGPGRAPAYKITERGSQKGWAGRDPPTSRFFSSFALLSLMGTTARRY